VKTNGRKMIGVWAGFLLATQSGCELTLRDAVATGVYDFVSASVTDALTALVPVGQAAEAAATESADRSR
jgi:hypothetical protein